MFIFWWNRIVTGFAPRMTSQYSFDREKISIKDTVRLYGFDRIV